MTSSFYWVHFYFLCFLLGTYDEWTQFDCFHQHNLLRHSICFRLIYNIAVGIFWKKIKLKLCWIGSSACVDHMIMWSINVWVMWCWFRRIGTRDEKKLADTYNSGVIQWMVCHSIDCRGVMKTSYLSRAERPHFSSASADISPDQKKNCPHQAIFLRIKYSLVGAG